MKTNLDSLFKTNEVLEEGGIWFTVSPEVSFRLRRFGGSNAKKVELAMKKHHAPHIRLIQAGALPKEKEAEIMAKVVVDACLVDWKGIEADGKPLECNAENAVKLFLELPELFNALFKYITEVESFKEELGNS